MTLLAQKYIRGDTAVKIAASVEQAIRGGHLEAGAALPPVRSLAQNLRVSPATVASAFASLKGRGLVVCEGRRGTRVSHRSVMHALLPPPLPAGVRNLRDGNPDERLLPSMKQALREIDPSPRLYGSTRNDERLIAIAAAEFKADGIPTSPISVLNGALDAMERVLRERLRPGDRVAVEDPGFGTIVDLLATLGLTPVPVGVDQEGIVPDMLERALRTGIDGLILMPRAQNPTGAAMTADRAAVLRRLLSKHPDVLVIEDDHASLICDAPRFSVIDSRRERWAVVRSMSKALNPDLRLALLTGDARSMTGVEDRLVVGERWVSHILQRIVAWLLSEASVRKQLDRAAATYRERRESLRRQLAQHGIESQGRSGFNVWVPVAEESAVVQGMLASGWGVSAGERFRMRCGPAIRITASTLEPAESARFASALATVLKRPTRTGAA